MPVPLFSSFYGRYRAFATCNLAGNVVNVDDMEAFATGCTGMKAVVTLQFHPTPTA